ncbi:unnamed protein product, partial [Sphenostylis stenocarpa]
EAVDKICNIDLMLLRISYVSPTVFVFTETHFQANEIIWRFNAKESLEQQKQSTMNKVMKFNDLKNG